MKRIGAGLLIVVGCLTLPAGVPAAELPLVVDAPTSARSSLQLTVYNSDLALVREVRRVELGSGPTLLHWNDVPPGLQARSVRIDLGNRRALEQDFITDVLSPDRVLDAHVGGEVTLLRADPGSLQPVVDGRLVSLMGGPVLETEEGYELSPPGHFRVATLPAGAAPRPYLRWLTDGPRGPADVDVRYLTTGLSWTADYAGRLDVKAGVLRLSSWVTVSNGTGTPFDGARLELVAGEVNRVAPERRLQQSVARMAMAADESVSGGLSGRPSFEYHVYEMERAVDLPRLGEKQILLHAPRDVPVERQYVVTSGQFLLRHLQPGDPERRPVEVRLHADNTEAGGLGMPLPEGTVRLYEADGRRERFIGEDRIEHTPAGESFSLVAGQAFDLVAERRQTDHVEEPQKGRRVYQAAFAISLRNRRKERVTIRVRESAPGDWTVLESSHDPTRLDSGTLEFRVEVPAGGETEITYRLRVGRP